MHFHKGERVNVHMGGGDWPYGTVERDNNGTAFVTVRLDDGRRLTWNVRNVIHV